MRVGLISSNVGGAARGGGRVRQMLHLSRGLKELGHDVVIASLTADRPDELRAEYPAVEWRFAIESEFRHPNGTRQLLDWYWRAMKPVAALVDDVDLVNPHEWPALRAGTIASKRLCVPCVWTRNDPTIFEVQFEGGSSLREPRRAIRRALFAGDRHDARRATAISVLDSKSADRVRAIYRREAVIARSGPDPVFFEPVDRVGARDSLGVAANELLLVAVGILFRHRRFEDLIDAMPTIRGEFDARALIIGSDHLNPSYGDELERRIDGSRHGTRITLMREAVQDDALRRLYAAADVFVHTHDDQTYGLAPLEALASGTPVALSRGAGVHEVLDGRPGVVTFNPRDPNDLARAVVEILSDAGSRAAVLSTSGWIRHELSPSSFAAQLLNAARV